MNISDSEISDQKKPESTPEQALATWQPSTRWWALLTLVLTAITLAVAIGAQPARAANTVAFLGSQSPNVGLGDHMWQLYDIDVSQYNDKIYIVDSAGTNNESDPQRIARYDVNGNFEWTIGKDVSVDGDTGPERCVQPASCKKGIVGEGRGEFAGPTGIAVNESDGTFYVAERQNSRLQKFTADGEFLFMFGAGVNKTTGGAICPRPMAPDDQCGKGESGTGEGQIGQPPGASGELRAAVSPIPPHNVYLGDLQNRRILEYTTDGEFSRAWGWGVDSGTDQFEICTETTGCEAALAPGPENGRFATRQPAYLAVDDNGILYASDTALGGRIHRFDTTVTGSDEGAGGAAETMLLTAIESTDIGGPLTSATTAGIAVLAQSGHLAVARNQGSGLETIIQEIDPETDTEVSGSPHVQGDGLTGNVRALDGTSTGGLMLAYTGSTFSHLSACREVTETVCVGLFLIDEDGPRHPAATVPPIEGEDVGGHEATLRATVDPNWGTVFHRFQYRKAGDSDWTPSPAGDWPRASGDGPRQVETTIEGLEANATYETRFRVLKMISAVTNSAITSPIESFETDRIPPDVDTRAPRQVGHGSALLVGRVNPNNLDTTYYFEYGTSAEYGTIVPVPGGDAGDGGQPELVSEAINGLQPETEYHYRVVATNDEGTSYGDDRLFTTTEAVPAPPGRAYEMVTPPDKNNRILGMLLDFHGTPIPVPGIPSSDGSRVLYPVQNGILDATAGTAFPNEYDFTVIERGETRWQAKSLFNLKAQIGAVGPRVALGGISGDLRTSSWGNSANLFPSPAPGVTGSTLGTKILGDTGGYQGSGWYDWTEGAAAFLAGLPPGYSRDASVLSEDGSVMVRWDPGHSPYRGLLGEDDPSNAQTSGTAIYMQSPPGNGTRSLLHTCTGEGDDATEVPARDGQGTTDASDDRIGARPCFTDELIDPRGAGLGATMDRGPAATAMSEDGRRIFFVSPDPSASSGDCEASPDEATRCGPQLYVRDLTGEEPRVRWLSRPRVDDQEVGLLGRTIFEGASADGSTVYFRTASPLLDGDPNGEAGPPPGGVKVGSASKSSWDLYRLELPTEPESPLDAGELVRVSGGPSGEEDPNTNPGGPSAPALRYVSDDGKRAYFVTGGEITGANNAPPRGGATSPGGGPTSESYRNLYLYDATQPTPRWKFIARLPFPSDTGHVDACASQAAVTGPARNISQRGALGRGSRSCFRGSPDGNVVAFSAAAQLTADDDDQAADIYAYDAERDRLTRVTAPPTEVEPYPCELSVTAMHPWQATTEMECNGDLGFWIAGTSNLNDRIGTDGYRHANVGADGTVFFETRLALVPEDTNGRHYDVYAWRNGELTLISPGNEADHAFYSGNSVDGRSVFIYTSQRISPWEIEDDDFDVYAARVGGGLPDPPLPPDGCDVLRDHCQEPTAAPEDPQTAVADPLDPGNVRPRTERKTCDRAVRKARKARKGTRRAAARLKRLRARSARAHGERRRSALRRKAQRARKVKRKAKQRQRRAASRQRKCMEGQR